jgi:hypothetical protein
MAAEAEQKGEYQPGFIFIPQSNAYAFSEEKGYYYTRTLLPINPIHDRNSCLIILIKKYIRENDDGIKRAIVFLNQSMGSWSKEHFINFLGVQDEIKESKLEPEDYSSDSDNDGRDIGRFADHKLEEKIVHSLGSKKRDELNKRVSTQITSNVARGLFQDSLTSSAEERRSYFPIPSEIKNDEIKRELSLINSTVSPSSEAKLIFKKDEKNEYSYTVSSASVPQGIPQGIPQVIALKHNYFVPFFRGISYLVDRWSRAAKKKHDLLPLDHDLSHYSEAVVKTIEEDFYKLENYDSIDIAVLSKNARHLKTVLINCKRSEPYILTGPKINRQFDNFLDGLQFCFSNGIVNFLDLLTIFNKNFPGVFPNDRNPFVPFSQLPFHAVRYAFGEKNPYKDFAIIPLWDKTGRARRPHIGKLYLCICPLRVFSDIDEPNVVPYLAQVAGVTPARDVGPEYEVSFLSFVPKEYMFKSYRIRYPSFHKDYNDKMLGKYGLTRECYEGFKNCILSADVKVQDAATQLLRNWLCLFYAIKAINEAQLEIQRRNGVCIFRHPDGSFQLDYPSEESSLNNEDKKNRELLASENEDNSEPFILQQLGKKKREFRSVISEGALGEGVRSPMSHQTPPRIKFLPLQAAAGSPSPYTPASAASTSPEDNIFALRNLYEESYQKNIAENLECKFSEFPLGDSSQASRAMPGVGFFASSSQPASAFSEAKMVDVPGLNDIEIKSDGHCLYRSITFYFTNGENVQDLRNIVADNIEKNIEDLRPIIGPTISRSLEQYINGLRNSNDWAGDLEIATLMQVLNRPIIQIGVDGGLRADQNIPENLHGDPIFVRFDGHHFNPLIMTGKKTLNEILKSFGLVNKSPKPR